MKTFTLTQNTLDRIIDALIESESSMLSEVSDCASIQEYIDLGDMPAIYYKLIAMKENKEIKITKDNFHIHSEATFELCESPTQEPDFISGEGFSQSKYWYIDDTLYRESNHWNRVFKCFWSFNTVWNYGKMYVKNSRIQFKAHPVYSADNCYINGKEVRICGKVKFDEIEPIYFISDQDEQELIDAFGLDIITNYLS